MKVEDIVDTKILEGTAVTYSVAVLFLGYLWQVLIFFNGGVESPLIPVTMFIPGILALIFRFRTGEGFGEIGWNPRNIKLLVLAVFLPLVLALSLVLALQALGWASLTVFTLQEGLVVSKVPLVLGTNPQGVVFFGLNLALTFVPITVLGGIFTLGEEYGWRGYLQSKMIIKYGAGKGLILLGLIWGYWHLPLDLIWRRQNLLVLSHRLLPLWF